MEMFFWLALMLLPFAAIVGYYLARQLSAEVDQLRQTVIPFLLQAYGSLLLWWIIDAAASSEERGLAHDLLLSLLNRGNLIFAVVAMLFVTYFLSTLCAFVAIAWIISGVDSQLHDVVHKRIGSTFLRKLFARSSAILVLGEFFVALGICLSWALVMTVGGVGFR